MKTRKAMFSKETASPRRSREATANKSRRATAGGSMTTGWSALSFWRSLAAEAITPPGAPVLKRYHD
jgi:anti-sigma-K factor RskA